MTRLAARPHLVPLEVLAGVVRELELVAGHSLQEFREGIYVRRAAERLVQLGVDLACGVALQALAGEEKARAPGGCEEAFRELARRERLPGPLAEKMVSAVVLRRRIVFGWPPQPGEDEELRADPDEDLHRRLPFLAVLLREYGRHMEETLHGPGPSRGR